MSKASWARLLTPPPAPDGVRDSATRKYLEALGVWLSGVLRAHNLLLDVQAAGVEQSTFLGRSMATKAPTDTYLVFNAMKDQASIWRKTDGSLTSWAFRFDNTTDKMEILYCAPATDPIVWTTYLSMNNTGIPVDPLDIVRLADLSGTALFSHMQTLSNTTSIQKRLNDLELKVDMMTQPPRVAVDVDSGMNPTVRGVSKAELEKEVDSIMTAVWMRK